MDKTEPLGIISDDVVQDGGYATGAPAANVPEEPPTEPSDETVALDEAASRNETVALNEAAALNDATAPNGRAVPNGATVPNGAAVSNGATAPNGATALNDATAPNGAATPNKTVALPPEYADDPVAAKRIAHGLSPTPTSAKSSSADGVESANNSNGSGSSGGSKSGKSKRDANAPRQAFSKERREQKEAEERLKKLRHQRHMRLLRRIILAIVLLVIAAACIGFWMIRWGCTDDAATIQGKWRAVGSQSSIEITDSEIILTGDVAYDYIIDAESKTIYYTFGGLSGQGRYRLSLDGNQLSLEDGEFDWLKTLTYDAPWTIEAVAAQLAGKPAKSPALGETSRLFERASSDQAEDQAGSQPGSQPGGQPESQPKSQPEDQATNQ